MGWSLYFVVLFSAFCIIEGQLDESNRQFPELRDPGDLLRELLGIKPCVGENCEYPKPGYEPVDPVVEDWEPQHPDPEESNSEVYEPQHPDPEQSNSEVYEPQTLEPEYPTKSEFCPDVCQQLLLAVKEIESKHPDIAEVKCDVLKELIRITSFYSVSRDGCHPAAKLLDLILLAADRLKKIYALDSSPGCEYMENPITEEPSEMPITREVYEPQRPKPEYPTKSEFCPDVCQELLLAVKEIEGKHPDIAEVKCDVLKELIQITTFYSVSRGGCHPVVKILDLILLASDRMKKIHALDSSPSCDYMEHPITAEPSEIPITMEPSEVPITVEPEMPAYTSAVYDQSPVSTSTEYKPEESSYPKVKPEQSMDSTSEAPKEPCPFETEEPETTSAYEQTTMGDEMPCPPKPCEDGEPAEEINAEEEEQEIYPPFVGSMRGMPGEHYPNYSEVPITSFSCSDKKYIPGFYADLETGCQVFHVCYEHRRESFLCPIGTIFNQPILACDYWYSSNCSLAPVYYEVNAKTDEISEPEEMDTAVGELIESIIEGKQEIPKGDYEKSQLPEPDLEDIVKFLPVKAKVTVFTKTEVKKSKYVAPEKPAVQDVSEVASQIFDNIISTATRVASKARHVIDKIPEPTEMETKKPILDKQIYMKPLVKPVIKVESIPVIAKAKFATKLAVPVAAKAKFVAAVPVAKLVAAKAAIPVMAKAKLAAVPVAKLVAAKAAIPVMAKAKLAAAVPVAKAKVAIAAKAAIPVVAKAKVAAAVPVAKLIATKAAIPVMAKAKLAAAVPVAKAKVAVAAKAAIPVVAKAKVAVAAKAIPVVAKAKVAASVPLAKVVAVKTAVPVIAKAKVAAVVAKAKVAAPVAAKSKLIAGKVIASKVAIPVAKVAASKIAVPIAAKAKLSVAIPSAKLAAAKSAKIVATKAAVPVVVKGKVAATLPFAKAMAIKASVPALKTKILAASVPFAKSAILKSTVPVAKVKLVAPALKAKAFKAASFPLVKGKLFALPLAKSKFAGPILVKAKLAKAAAISPLTKKALALGYMKLLKAKKLALLG